MKDKQIIIDGVDVSGCEHCLKMTKYRCTIQRDVYKCLCEENPNCDHKQLKRLEKLLPDINGKFYKAVDDLKVKEQECEELKVENKKLKEKLLAYEIKDKEQIMSNYCKNCYELTKQLDQTKADNDSLKSELMQTNCYLEADKEIIDQLKAKNTCLKKCNERLLQAIIKDQAEIVQKNIDETNISLLKENMDLQRQIDQLKAENDESKQAYQRLNNMYNDNCNFTGKLEQTLTEIKEIAETAAKCLYTTKSEDYTDGYSWLGSIILQKISECEVEK